MTADETLYECTSIKSGMPPLLKPRDEYALAAAAMKVYMQAVVDSATAQSFAPDASWRGRKHGYVALLGLRTRDAMSVIAAAQKGLPFTAVERLRQSTGLMFREIRLALGMSERTFWRRSEKGRFDAVESDRLLRLARVLAQAMEVFEGNAWTATSWLKRSHRAFGGGAPLRLTQTDAGVMELMSHLERVGKRRARSR